MILPSLTYCWREESGTMYENKKSNSNQALFKTNITKHPSFVSDLHFYVSVLHLSWNQTVRLQLFVGQKLHFGCASSWACLSLNWQLWVLFIEDQRMFVAFLRSEQE